MPTLTKTNSSVVEMSGVYVSGEIAILEMLRDFVWDARRIVSLIHSPDLEYPPGAMVLGQACNFAEFCEQRHQLLATATDSRIKDLK